jgi:F0F1-type ATP synthase membrane subunit b/b'
MGITDFTNKYPYTDFHELNLDWLIERYTTLTEEVNTLKTWVAQHKIEYNEAMVRLEAVENEIDTFEQQITASFNQLRADLEADFAQQKAELEAALIQVKAEVDAELSQLQEDVAAAIAGFENQFKTLETSILNEVEQLKADVRREVTEFYNVMQANNEYVFTYVENRLDEFISSLPEILTVMVYNPYRGEVTDIQTAINDLYEVAAIWGLTASQYDSLGLTASEYDALDLTAREYDTLGYKLLYKDPDHYMISPFTGEYVPLQEVIDKLAQFHMEGLTASEYDVKDLTAEGYDALDLTAFNYDWFASQLIA